MKKDKILFSTICYNNCDEVISFAHQLFLFDTNKNFYLIIVCYKKSEYSHLSSIVININSSIELIYINENLGYLNGCIYGINHCLAKNNYIWAFIVNTDIKIISLNLMKLNDYAKDNVWIIGPKIYNKKDIRQRNPYLYNRPSRMKMLMKRIVFNYYLSFLIYNKYYELFRRKITKRAINSNEKNIYAVHGSFFAIKNELAELLFCSKPKIFMYGEEELLAALIYKNFKKAVYDEAIYIEHYGLSTTSSISMKNKFKYYKESYSYIYKEFFSNDC